MHPPGASSAPLAFGNGAPLSTGQGVPLSMGQGAPVAAIRELLAGVGTVEGRLAVTGAMVAMMIVLVAVVAPWIGRRVGSRFALSSPGERVDESDDPVQSGASVALARSLQLVTVVAAGTSVFVVWGQLDAAVAVLDRGGRPVTIAVNLTVTTAIVLLAYVGIGVLDDAIARFSAGADRVTDHQEEIVRRMGQLGIIALVVATGLTVWGVDLSGLLVGAGFLGIVVGLAARQTLGSLIAGFVLMFSRPFTIGDWVEIGDEEGIVTDITIVNTRLENFDGEFVVIPNDMVGNKPITNRSQKGHLRLRLDVGVDYDSDPDHAREVALDAMGEVETIEATPPPQAFLKSFGDSAVVIELRYWIDRPTPPRKWQATNAVVEAVKTAFDREGIKIPFPQRELTGRAETGGFQVRSEFADPGGRRDGRGARGSSNGDGRSAAAEPDPGQEDGVASDGDAED